MPLFNKKYIAKQIGTTPSPIPADHLTLLNEWMSSIHDESLFIHSEVSLHGSFKSKIIETILGYQSPPNSAWTVAAEETIGRGSADLALGHFSAEQTQIIAPFELKGAKTKDLDALMSGRNKSPVQQAWQYANAIKDCSWVLVSNYTELRLYSYVHGNQTYESFDFRTLTDPYEYARFQLLLGADNFLSGRTLDHLDASQKEEKDITNKLYADYQEIRHVLIDHIKDHNPEIDGETQIAYAQTTLDRVLFIAFAEDTGLLPQHSLKQAYDHADPYNPKPVWDNFKGLFKAIDKGNTALNIPRYNGGLFKRHPAIDKLKLPDLVCEGFKRLGDYDFASEVSVTILGHIFEQSITDLERLQAIARGDAVEADKKTGTTGKRKQDGVVYTPDYIARFIVAQTVGGHLQDLFIECLKPNVRKASLHNPYDQLDWKLKSSELKTWHAYQKRLGKLRIVDPACGSGVFLVTAFDFLKAEYHRVNAKVAELSRAGQSDLFDPDKEILSNNLYGVDVNSESVEITKLSLWLKTAKRGKVLDSLDTSVLVGDSLIEESNYAYMDHAFNWRDAFPKVFKDGGFDVVLGNPPYVRQERISPMKHYLEKQFEVYHGVADLYCYFFERGMRLLKAGGHLGYISNATFFKTASGQPLRRFLSAQTTLKTIVNFGDTQVFEGVTTYPAILVIQNQTAPEDHKVNFWNVAGLPDKDSFEKIYDHHKAPYSQSNLTHAAWELEDERLTALRQDPKSADVIKPWLDGRDIERWHTKNNDSYVIFTKRGIDIKAYPAVYNYLLQYQEILEPKPNNWLPQFIGDKWKGRKGGKYKWYEIQDSVDYYQKFETTKISYIEICNHNKFMIDSENQYLNATAFIIPNADFFLLSYLNSNAAWFFWSGETTILRGGFLRMKNIFVNPLPIPDASETDQADLANLAQQCQDKAQERYKRQHAITRRIPDLCPPEQDPKLSNKLKTWWNFADFQAFRKEIKAKFKQDIPLSDRTDWEDWMTAEKQEIHRLTGEITALEAQINQKVYSLFALTDEEIALLETSLNKG